MIDNQYGLAEPLCAFQRIIPADYFFQRRHSGQRGKTRDVIVGDIQNLQRGQSLGKGKIRQTVSAQIQCFERRKPAQKIKVVPQFHVVIADCLKTAAAVYLNICVQHNVVHMEDFQGIILPHLVKIYLALDVV